MTKYQWTDWITHVPGQQLPIGVYAIVEQVGHSGVPWTREGTMRAELRDHLSWFMTDPYGEATMITRYKLRSIALEDEQPAERELELSHG